MARLSVSRVSGGFALAYDPNKRASKTSMTTTPTIQRCWPNCGLSTCMSAYASMALAYSHLCTDSSCHRRIIATATSWRKGILKAKVPPHAHNGKYFWPLWQQALANADTRARNAETWTMCKQEPCRKTEAYVCRCAAGQPVCVLKHG